MATCNEKCKKHGKPCAKQEAQGSHPHKCLECKREKSAPGGKGKKPAPEHQIAPDWEHACEVCGETPIVPLTGMCGPCSFGEAETAGGNW